MKRPPSRARPESPSTELRGFIARFDPEIGALVRPARAALRRRFPTAVELVYHNYNALVIGFGSTERASDAIVSLAIYATGVNLYFIYGATLPDPYHLLQGSGSRGRFIRLERAALLAEPAVVALLKAATARAKSPMPAAGRGRTVIRAISLRQRSRRPAD